MKTTAIALTALASTSVAQTIGNQFGCSDPENYDTCETCLAAGCSMMKGTSGCVSMCPMDIMCFQGDARATADQVGAQCQRLRDSVEKDATCAEQTNCGDCSAEGCSWGVYGTDTAQNSVCINYAGGMMQFTKTDCQALDDCALIACSIPDCQPGYELKTTPKADGECCDKHECVKSDDCANFPCPIVDCQPGYEMKTTPKGDGECCDKHECVKPDDCANFPCPMPLCQPGYELKTTPKADGECCDKHECVKLDGCANFPCPILDCQQGWIVETFPKADGECCDKFECNPPTIDCTLVRCAGPGGTSCPKGESPQSTGPKADGECCEQYKCVRDSIISDPNREKSDVAEDTVAPAAVVQASSWLAGLVATAGFLLY